MTSLRISYFNCYGAINKLLVISDMCRSFDILFLQESSLMQHITGVFDTLNDDFESFSISAFDQEEIIVGRP